MHKLYPLISSLLIAGCSLLSAQVTVTTDTLTSAGTQDSIRKQPTAEIGGAIDTLPAVSYANPIHKVIAGIDIIGAKSFDRQVLLSLSGLSVGEEVAVPGIAFTSAIERFMRNGLFSDVKIFATKYEGNRVWIEIRLTERPRIYSISFHGIKKGEREDLEKRVGLRKGLQMTPNIKDRTVQLIRKYYDEKGYRDMNVRIEDQPNLSEEGFVNVDIYIKRNAKTKVGEITFENNHALSDYRLRMAMKKTNEGFSLRKEHFLSSILKIFSQKKFVDKDYESDLDNILNRYRQLGYRDAEIASDTIIPAGKNKVNIRLRVNEGAKYHIEGIKFVGNTKYSSEELSHILGIKTGDVYDQKKLEDRLFAHEDAMANLYYNNGYLFAQIDPVETRVANDSVDLEIRIIEGIPAKINRVIIKGNTIVYEDVVRRELFTRPGALFSKEDIMNSLRSINQLQLFDPEKIKPNPVPNPQTGTVDIEYELVPHSSDMFNISIGFSQTGLVGSVGLKFTNFAIRNLFRPSMYKGIIPQGDGQTLSIKAESNAKFYQSYSLSFMDPWFGGKRPNLLNVSAFYSRMTAIDEKYYNNRVSSYYNPMYDGYYGGGYGGYGGYGGGGYGGYGGYGGGYGNDIYEKAQDPDKSLQMFGVSIGFGKRLSWPDNWFQVYTSLNYTLYTLNNWAYETFRNFHQGHANDINLQLQVERNSMDNPIFTRTGSQFLLSVTATPPYSLFDGIDYSNPKLSGDTRYRFVEYHKWKFLGRVFTPLMNPATVKRPPVLMTRFEGGIIGNYTPHKRSPFGTYYMGGDAMGNYMGSYMNETIGLRGYKNGSISGRNYDYAYAYMRLAMELRYPILLGGQTNIWALAFVEAGNAWSRAGDYNPFNLKRSAGLGIRITLPMLGIVGLDWGYGFDRPDKSSERGGSNIHFILGQEF